MIKNARFFIGRRKRCYKRHLLNLQEQSVIFNCERDSQDPLIAHELVLETDQYGNVLQSAKVVYPRKHILGHLPQKGKDEQAKMQTDGSYWLPSGKAVYYNPTTKFNHVRKGNFK